jgi:hypothetical protein
MKRSVNDNPVRIEDNGTQCCLFGYGDSNTARRVVEKPADETDMDKVLAREIHNLSLQERNRVYEEVHGVAEPLQEDPEFEAQRLSEFDWHLSKNRNKPAYDFALQQSPEYVNDRKFRLMFLKSTEFDAQKASLKFVNHFDFKMDIFGREKLARNITLGDLDEEDLIYLRSGAIQILPAPDRIGRPIFFLQHETMAIAIIEGCENSVV